MNRPFILIATIFAVWLVGCAEAPRSVRVMSYNVHWCKGMDGKYDVPRVAKVITDSGADLVALQEVDVNTNRNGRVDQAVELGRLTGMHVYYGATQEYDGGLFGNAVLSRWPLRDTRMVPLPSTESTATVTHYPRGAAVAEVIDEGGRRIRFISTHFQHNLESDRVNQATAINALLASDDGVPTILAGDLNARPDSEPMRIIHQRWRNTMADPPAPTSPSVNPRNTIDYILYRPAEALRVASMQVLDEQMASDHRPVVADLEWVAPPPRGWRFGGESEGDRAQRISRDASRHQSAP